MAPTKTTETLKLTHNHYVYGKPADFRIGYLAYRVWTLKGFYVQELAERAEQAAREASHGLLHQFSMPAYMLTLDAYIAEQYKRAGDRRVAGAQPGPTTLVGDRREGARMAAQFEALPELRWGDIVELDGVKMVIDRDPNNHVKFLTAQEMNG